jgi:hypothetical protein
MLALLCGESWGVPAAAVLQKQFLELDSALLRLAAAPEVHEVHAKKAESVNTLLRRALVRYPAIEALVRTNAKGLVVNDQERRGRAEKLRTDASDSVWYSGPGKTLVPWYGPVVKDKMRPYCVWSRPVILHSAIGGDRFGGVIAITIDVFACFRDFAAHVDGPFEILLGGRSFYYLSWADTIHFEETSVPIPGTVVFGLRMPKAVAEVRTVSMGAQQTIEHSVANAHRTETDSLTRAEEPGSAGQDEDAIQRCTVSGNMWMWFAGAAVIIAAAFGAVFFFGRARRRAAQARADAGDGAGGQVYVPAVPVAAGTNGNAGEVRINAAGSAPVAEELSVLQTNNAPSGADAEPLVGDADRERIGNEEQKRAEEEYREKVRAEVREALAAEMRAELAAKVRAEVEEKERDEIYKKELDALTSAVQQELAEKDRPALVESQRERLFADIRENVTKSLTGEYEEKARAALRAEVERKVVSAETERIHNEEIRRIRESIREKLIADEAPKLAHSMREMLAQEIRAKIDAGEGDVIREGILVEIKAGVKGQLLATEYERIRAEQLEKMERELYSEVVAAEKEKIRSALLEKVTREEHERIRSEERPAIIEAERSRLLAKESPALREEIRRKIRGEEMQAIRDSVKSEIYSETVQAIRNGLEEKYASAVRERVAGMKDGLGKKARIDLKIGIEEDYRGLAESVEQLLSFLADNEALKSLGQTVSLMAEEKKKYKYFNLNAVQTESLLDYLKRVHARFNIYLDAVDQRVRGLMLTLGNLKNKLDKEV